MNTKQEKWTEENPNLGLSKDLLSLFKNLKVKKNLDTNYCDPEADFIAKYETVEPQQVVLE